MLKENNEESDRIRKYGKEGEEKRKDRVETKLFVLILP